MVMIYLPHRRKSYRGSADTWSANNATLSPLDAYLKGAWNLADTSDQLGVSTLTNTNSVSFANTGVGGRKCATFNASNYLYAADGSRWNIGTSDFFLSWWAYHDAWTSPADTRANLSHYKDDNNHWTADIYSSYIDFSHHSGGAYAINVRAGSLSALSTGTWYHFVITRISGAFAIYLNATSKTITINDNPSASVADIDGAVFIGLGRWPDLNGRVQAYYFGIGTGITSDQATALYNSGNGSFYTG